MKKINWNLEDVLPFKDYATRLANAEITVEKFATEITNLDPAMSLERFKKLINDYESLLEELMRLYSRALLWEEVAQHEPEPKYMKSKANNLLVNFDDKTRIFWLWIKGKEIPNIKILDNDNAERLFNAVPAIKFILERERQQAKYSLSNESESIITNKDINGVSTLLDLRAQLDTGIQFNLTLNGKKRIIKNVSELMQLVQSKNPRTREKAYRALYKHYKKHEHKYFAIYESIVKNWNYEVKLRGYSSAINMRNVKNDIPDEVISVLLKTCEKNATVFQRFFKLKAKALGVSKLRRFDLYAPLPNKDTETRYNYKESLEIVSEVLKAFDNDFYLHLTTILNSNHIDAFPDSHKAGGAFCMTISNNLTPYVMLNYLGSKRDVMTMSHEFGHAIHSLFSAKQSILAQEAPLPLAETASTFSETLVFEKMYANAKTKEEKRSMLFHKLSDSYATIMRQNYFVLFELEAHKLIPEGVRINDLHKKYLENLNKQFDGAVEVDEVFQYEWLYIPHIVNSPFYCYAYSFGELLAMSLFNNFKQHGKEYNIKIKNILMAGGSENAVALLAQQGIDITKEAFWQASFDYISTQIDELESLM